MFFYRARRRGHELSQVEVDRSSVTVVLTAYNDEPSIANAVRDFRRAPADEAGDRRRQQQRRRHRGGGGRGRGHRGDASSDPGTDTASTERSPRARSYDDTALVALCEGDMTFRAADLEKLLAYIPHGDVVNGTRIVEQLREKVTQLTTFMFWGNFVGGKLLEFKHLGRGTVTDLGTTYKLCRSSFLREHLADYDPRVNLEFNAHFLDTTMKNGFKLVEAPDHLPRSRGRVEGWQRVEFPSDPGRLQDARRDCCSRGIDPDKGDRVSDSESANSYFDSRLKFDQKRVVLWSALWDYASEQDHEGQLRDRRDRCRMVRLHQQRDRRAPYRRRPLARSRRSRGARSRGARRLRARTSGSSRTRASTPSSPRTSSST